MLASRHRCFAPSPPQPQAYPNQILWMPNSFAGEVISSGKRHSGYRTAFSNNIDVRVSRSSSVSLHLSPSCRIGIIMAHIASSRALGTYLIQVVAQDSTRGGWFLLRKDRVS